MEELFAACVALQQCEKYSVTVKSFASKVDVEVQKYHM